MEQFDPPKLWGYITAMDDNGASVQVRVETRRWRVKELGTGWVEQPEQLLFSLDDELLTADPPDDPEWLNLPSGGRLRLPR